MLHRRHAISILLAGLSVTTLMPSTGRADQRFRRFLPFLVELKGWTGQEPTGFAMENAGMSMVTATREYRRNDARLNAGLVSGPLAAAFTSPNAGMNIETTGWRMNTKTIDGFPVMKSFTAADSSGSILVSLDKEVMFTFSYNGISEDEAMGLAKQFNWKSMQAAF